jgi:hypothetical protein
MEIQRPFPSEITMSTHKQRPVTSLLSNLQMNTLSIQDMFSLEVLELTRKKFNDSRKWMKLISYISSNSQNVNTSQAMTHNFILFYFYLLLFFFYSFSERKSNFDFEMIVTSTARLSPFSSPHFQAMTGTRIKPRQDLPYFFTSKGWRESTFPTRTPEGKERLAILQIGPATIAITEKRLNPLSATRLYCQATCNENV